MRLDFEKRFTTGQMAAEAEVELEYGSLDALEENASCFSDQFFLLGVA